MIIKKVIIDPLVNIYYASFYIYGLVKLFGKKAIIYDEKPFREISDRSNLNFIIIDKNKETKYTINFDDSYKIKEDVYRWCDIYGNVNANFEKTENKFHEKLISLAPSFGIRFLNCYQTYFLAFNNLLKIESKLNVRKFLGKYKRQLRLRLPYSFYETEENSQRDYIFHLSTLWYNDEWNKNDDGVNLSRSNFINACKSINRIKFEGGLSVSQKECVNPVFSQVIYDGTISLNKYLEKTKQSALVFNAPAFWSCHGWKLGEYLALGKAIISTSLSNDLPAPLVHGENIHFVENNIESIKDALSFILNDETYRIKLENGAREYWRKYGTPEKSLALLGIE